MFVCVARLTLQIPESGSLKAKRQVLRRVTDRVKARFNVSVAEVDDNELWQRATLALAVVGNERKHVVEMMEKIIHFVDEMYVAPLVSREMETLAFGDELFAGAHGAGKAGVAMNPDGTFQVDTGQRSLAEAEGLGEWEDRHDKRKAPALPKAAGKQKLSIDDARAHARRLRNPREWEKK